MIHPPLNVPHAAPISYWLEMGRTDHTVCLPEILPFPITLTLAIILSLSSLYLIFLSLLKIFLIPFPAPP